METKAEERIKQALEYCVTTDLLALEDGRIEIADDIYANVATYKTKEYSEVRYEDHKKYIDIQYMIQGVESIFVTDAKSLTINAEYDEDRDVSFYDNPKSDTKELVIRSGEYAVIYPGESHKPSVKYQESLVVKKIVVKVLV